MANGEKWTEGEWLLASRPSSVVGWPIVASPQGRSIGHVTYGPVGDAFSDFNAESEANGHLIAAAPDLFTACTPLALSDPENPPPGVAVEDWRGAVLASRAARAKARGEA